MTRHLTETGSPVAAQTPRRGAEPDAGPPKVTRGVASPGGSRPAPQPVTQITQRAATKLYGQAPVRLARGDDETVELGRAKGPAPPVEPRVPLPPGGALPSPDGMPRPCEEEDASTMTQAIRVRRVARRREAEADDRRARQAQPRLWTDVSFPIFVSILCASPGAFHAAQGGRWGSALLWLVGPALGIAALTVPFARWLSEPVSQEPRRQ